MLPIPKRFESYKEIEDFVDQNFEKGELISLPNMISRVDYISCFKKPEATNDWEEDEYGTQRERELGAHLSKMIDWINNPELELFYLCMWLKRIAREKYMHTSWWYSKLFDCVELRIEVVILEKFLSSPNRNYNQALNLLDQYTQGNVCRNEILDYIHNCIDEKASRELDRQREKQQKKDMDKKEFNNQKQSSFILNGDGNVVGDKAQVSNDKGTIFKGCTFYGGVPSVPTNSTSSTKQDKPEESDDDLPSWYRKKEPKSDFRDEPLPF